MSNVYALRPMTTPVNVPVTVLPMPTALLPHGTATLLAGEDCLPVPVTVLRIAMETLAEGVLSRGMSWEGEMKGAFDALVLLDIVEAAGLTTAVSDLRDDLIHAYQRAADMLED